VTLRFECHSLRTRPDSTETMSVWGTSRCTPEFIPRED
jgi:hypothetical protein